MELNLFDDSLIANPFNEELQRDMCASDNIFNHHQINFNDILDGGKRSEENPIASTLKEDNPRISLPRINSEISNDEFLRYLDTHFTPEIELSNDPKHSRASLTQEKVSRTKKILVPNDSTKDSTLEVRSVNLKYKGQKNKFSKGIFAERVDVLYKTLLRSIRRFLWDLFSQEHNSKDIKDKAKASHQFKSKLVEYFQKYFQSTLRSLSDDEEQEQLFIENLASFMTSKFWIPDNSFRIRKFRVLITSNLKQYSAYKYCEFFKVEGCVRFFQVLRNSGFIERIIEAYPKLRDSREAYLQIVEEIATIS